KLRQFHSNFPSKLGLAVLIEKSFSELNNFRFVSAGCFFYPDAEIIGPFGGGCGWSGVDRMIQVLPCFIEARRCGMKRQLGQANPRLRYPRICWKIVNESFQRSRCFFVCFGSLHQTFLQPQIGTRLFVASLFFQLVVIGKEASVISDL